VNRITRAATSAVVIVARGWPPSRHGHRRSDRAQALRPVPSRYQIGVMERVLETAVEQGRTKRANVCRRSCPPTVWSPVSESARARGFRSMAMEFLRRPRPSIEGTLAWSFSER